MGRIKNKNKEMVEEIKWMIDRYKRGLARVKNGSRIWRELNNCIARCKEKIELLSSKKE